MKNSILTIIFMFSFAQAQGLPSETQIPAPTISGITGGWLDSEKLKIQQGFSLGTALMGGQSTSYGMLTNHFQYEVNPKLSITGGVHLLQRNQSLPGQFQSMDPDVLFDVNVRYQPWENAWFHLSVGNFGTHQLRQGQFLNK